MNQTNQNNTGQDANAGQQANMTGIGMIPDSLFEVLWRNRWIVLLCIVLAVAAGFIYVLHATPIFESTSQVYVEQSGPRIIDDVQGYMTQSKNYLYTQAELLRSTPILSDALDQPGVRRMASFEGIDNPVGYLKKTLNVSVGKKDDIISVTFESPYPAEAAQLINSVVDSYITYNASRKKTSAGEVLKILQAQKEKAFGELTTKRQTLMDFQKTNPAITFETSRGNIVLERLARLSEALTTAELATVQAKSDYESMKDYMEDPASLRQFIEARRSANMYGGYNSGGQVQQLQYQLDELNLQLEETLKNTKLTSDHPTVTNLQRKIDLIKKRIETIDTDYAKAMLAVAEQDMKATEENEKQIRDYFEQQRTDALDLSEKHTQYAILQSDITRSENLCDILDDRIKEINVTEDTGALNISILEVAAPADKPSKPQKARILAMALVLGMMLGGGVSLVRDWMDHRLRSADEISAILGVPVLGTVPRITKAKAISDKGMLVHKKTTSPTAEAYRTIRTAVFFGVPDGKAQTMVITSPAPGDGKSTLASNLAIAMAQADQRTIILDADLRKSVQHAIFSKAVQPGITTILSGQASLTDCVQATGVPNLDILPAGPEVANPSEMLNSNAFKALMAQLTQKYDRIIIDSPPVMPVTDSRILAAFCDVTLLVLRAEKSTRKGSQQARDGLLSVGANLLGAVVNDVAKGKGRYGYYSGYGGGYGGYGYYGRKQPSKPTIAVSS